MIVLRGEPTLRTPEGEHVLNEGDVVCFAPGKDGAHQIINGTDSPIRGPDIQTVGQLPGQHGARARLDGPRLDGARRGGHARGVIKVDVPKRGREMGTERSPAPTAQVDGGSVVSL
jgi:hypothetical protein